MFKDLEKYQQDEHTHDINESHSKKRNAPRDSKGVYLVYHNGNVIYISSSGRVTKNNLEPTIRVADDGRLWARVISGRLPDGKRINQRLLSNRIDSVTCLEQDKVVRSNQYKF